MAASETPKVSKNNTTIPQLKLACRHIKEMMALDMTENHAIRLLELIADVYAKVACGGRAKVWYVDDVPRIQWSLAALRWRKAHPRKRAGTNLRVEHGTPRRIFAKKVFDLCNARRLTTSTMNRLVKKCWRIAVVTHEEDRRISRKQFKTPHERWAAAGIRFPKNSPNAR